MTVRKSGKHDDWQMHDVEFAYVKIGNGTRPRMVSYIRCKTFERLHVYLAWFVLSIQGRLKPRVSERRIGREA